MDQIRAKAKVLGIDEEALVVKALKDFLYLNRVNAIREKMENRFREMGIQSEEDIFERVS